MDRKMVPLHKGEREIRLWREAEQRVRENLGMENAREGEVLAEICADYLGREARA